ncbi:MAG: hypothetical protein SGBAC_004311 [Bacillariaceae sp.]
MASSRDLFSSPDETDDEQDLLTESSFVFEDEQSDPDILSLEEGPESNLSLKPSESQPLRAQHVAPAVPIKVFTGAPLQEYRPQRKSKDASNHSQKTASFDRDLHETPKESSTNKLSTLSADIRSTDPSNDGRPSILSADIQSMGESARSKHSMLSTGIQSSEFSYHSHTIKSIGFESPSAHRPASLFPMSDVDSADSGSEKPMSYFPTKYRMQQSLRSIDATPIPHPYQESSTSPISAISGGGVSQMSTPSPSNQSQSTSFSRLSHMSAESKDSSVMSYRSSTSKSLLFGEVINLEGVRRPQNSGHKQHRNFITKDHKDLEGQGGFVGMEIGGESGDNSKTMRALPFGGQQEKYLPNGVSARFFLDMMKDAREIGKTTTLGFQSIRERAMEMTQNLMQYYSPPLSPRTKALKDLQFLQQAHREKFGRFVVDDDDSEDHWDFALVLTPQEAYRFWSALLDFRAEYLGFEALNNMEPSLKSNSTDTTDKSPSNNSTENGPRTPGFFTPISGIKRRRGRTPLSENRTHLRSAAKAMFPSGDTPSTLRIKQRKSMFEKAVGIQDTPMTAGKSSVESTPMTNDTRVSEPSTVRRRWGNQTQGSSMKNLLSPPTRSLTRGASSVSRMRINTGSLSMRTSTRTLNVTGEGSNAENTNPNIIMSEEDIPNPVIPRGIAARTNGLLRFLSALQRGIVLRRHRSNKEAVFCKIFSEDGGDTIQYQVVDPEEAMVAFKEQRVRHNKHLTHSSSPTSVRAVTRGWACLDGPGEGSDTHKFKVPDHIAAQRYRQRLSKEHAFSKRVIDLATKAANSGVVKSADIAAVHPATHLDPRHPGVRKGELGTASLRKSRSEFYSAHAFSLVTTVHQSFPTGTFKDNDGSENKWYSGEGNDIQFKNLDFEAATEGEYWLIFRGFLLLHRDATVGRFASERRAGIGGGSRNRTEDGDKEDCDYENMLHRDEFTEPSTPGCIEKLVVKLRKLDTTYMKGDMMAGAAPPPSDYFLGFKSPGTQIWSRLRLAGLETQRLYSVNTNKVMIKVRCPEDRLTDVAEVLRLHLKTKDGAFAPFREDTATHFIPKEDVLDVPSIYQGKMASLLGSKDRQTIIDFIIASRIRDSGAELVQSSDLGRMIQSRVPLHMPHKLEALYKVWVTYWKRENWTGKDWTGVADDDTVHSEYGGEPRYAAEDKFVPGCITRFLFGAFHQPLDEIEEYLGEQVAFYFAWLEHCSWHLLVMTVFGLVVTACQLSSSDFDHWIRPYFAVAVMLWTFMVLINWRKRNSYLAHKWGSLDVKVQETPRPEFYGDYVIDEITHEWVVKYPAWKRWLKYLISVPISLFFTISVMILILNVHANRDLQMAKYVEQLSNPDAKSFEFEWRLDPIGEKAPVIDIPITRELLLDRHFWVALGALPAMLGISIPIMNVLLMMVASKLTSFENYRTEAEYRTHLVIKVFSFRFASQFGTLYYYAAISQGSPGAVENGIIRMGTSLVMYTTIAYYWNIILQVYFFMLIRNIRHFFYKKKLQKELRKIEIEEELLDQSKASDVAAHEMKLINKRMLLDQAQDDAWFEVMRPGHDSFPEYITSVLQFSMVACFSVVLPITPLFVLINYLMSMRFDAYKICRGRQRPLSQKTGGMGIWEDLLHIVAVIAVLTNCTLIAFTNSDFIKLTERIGSMGIFVVVVGWEHLMLLIKYVMQTVISPLPKSVRDELKNKQHQQEKERYSTMRLKNGVKKTASQRSLFRRAKREKDNDECVSLLSKDYSTPEENDAFEDESRSLYSC